MSTTKHCPALLISAPASGQGKTTITAALAKLYREQGKRVRVFKTGPDFLDPMILEQASGLPVYQLDLWMGGEAHCRQLLYQAACEADLILIEGVMGLFDGTTSSADLAGLFGIPIVAVIDATAMAQTFGAIAHGLAHYRKGLPFAGVIANRVASAGHGDMLAESLNGIPYIGALARDPTCELPSRHLGLIQAEEIADLDTRINTAKQHFVDAGFDYQPAPVAFAQAESSPPTISLHGQRIAVARDSAFAFVYRVNLELLEAMGAELCYFSPLQDTRLPAADSLYLPGGYPELHLEVLASNTAMHKAIKTHQQQGKPIVAECGGMLYLLETLTDKEGHSQCMVGLLQGHGKMQKRLANLGMHRVELPEGVIHGHTFHHSTLDTNLPPLAMSESSRKRGRGEAIYRQDRLHASYLHMYFPSNPEASARLFMP
ncbi:Cobyrinic acid a,c-diamide synthetase [hydrothermal vent metagenome]|uniref:Cobyrinic acid a,c-diamide synthetase n=1 Tax=hydrothermal vent metagenome TaxID=652676 RepID=A0A3B1ARQ4_9ZZZZ